MDDIIVRWFPFDGVSGVVYRWLDGVVFTGAEVEEVGVVLVTLPDSYSSVLPPNWTLD